MFLSDFFLSLSLLFSLRSISMSFVRISNMKNMEFSSMEILISQQLFYEELEADSCRQRSKWEVKKWLSRVNIFLKKRYLIR